MRHLLIVLVCLGAFAADAIKPANRIPHTLSFAIGEWKPFISEEAEGYGPVVRLVDAVCREAGFECTYEFMPWKRAWVAAKTGNYDGTFAWAYSDKRIQEMHYISKKLLEIPSAIFYRKAAFETAPEWTSLDDLAGKGYRIVDVRGYFFGQELQRKGTDVHIVNSDDLRWKMMAQGKMDVTVYELPSGMIDGRRIVPEFDQQVAYITLPKKTDFYLFFSRVRPDEKLLQKKMRVFEEVFEQGDFQIALPYSIPD